MPPVHRTARERACAQILEKLVSGELPPGTHLSEVQLSKAFGLSRAPIREAIGELSSRGWLDMVPGLGAYVKTPDKRELRELYECREALECLAVELAVERIAPRQLHQLALSVAQMGEVIERVERERLERFDDPAALAWMEADLQLHQTLIEAAANRKLASALASLHVIVRGWSRQPDFVRFPMLKMLRASYREHGEIAAAVARHDRERARWWMRRHVRRTAWCFLRQHAADQPIRLPREVVARMLRFEADLSRLGA